MSSPDSETHSGPARDISRALVIKFGHIGDVLVTTPVFTALKEAYPGVRTTALVAEGTESMVQNSPYVDQVLVLRRKHPSKRAAVSHQLGLMKALRKGRFDLSLELSDGDRGCFLSLVAGAKFRMGFEPKKPHLRTRIFHRTAPVSGAQDHMVEVFLRQIRAMGINPKDTGLKLYPGEQAQARADAIMAGHGLTQGGFALVHPTSRWMFKCWTPDGNRAVIEHLAGLGLKVVVTAAPVNKELEFLGQVLEGLSVPVLNLAGELDLSTLAALIARARIFFGVDSAPMHMAAAAGTPTAVLFGPSGERMWGPWQVASEVLAGDCEDHPCGRDGCDGTKISRCLVELEPRAVTQAIDRLLAGS